MENASKALLIAGSILIVILLIGVGMLIYNAATGVWGNARNRMSDLEIQAFNSEFETYRGSNRTKSEVETLFGKVRTNNINSDNKIQFISNDVKYNSKLSGTTNASKYTIDFDYDSTGLISNVLINATSGSLTVVTGTSSVGNTVGNTVGNPT